MKKIIKKFVSLLSLPSILVVMFGCGSDSPNGPSGATVEGRLTLPTEASGNEYWVLIDTDIDGDNGYVRAVSGNCGSGTSVNYSSSDVPAGAYYVYAGVRMVSSSGAPPENGDYIGIYGGTFSNVPSQPNAVVPSSGTVTFNITLDMMGGVPKPGEWTASVDFGGFDFVVNSESTAITNITYNFSGWTCGGVTRSGSIGVSSSSGWAISDREFEIETDLDPDPFSTDPIAINGTFGESGDQASGTWEAVVNSTTCSGSWQAFPVD